MLLWNPSNIQHVRNLQTLLDVLLQYHTASVSKLSARTRKTHKKLIEDTRMLMNFRCLCVAHRVGNANKWQSDSSGMSRSHDQAWRRERERESRLFLSNEFLHARTCADEIRAYQVFHYAMPRDGLRIGGSEIRVQTTIVWPLELPIGSRPIEIQILEVNWLTKCCKSI